MARSVFRFMGRSFVEMQSFTKKWFALGLTDDDLRLLQAELLENPKSGSVMQGAGGLRKIRAPIADRGKSGGVRVCYVDFEFAGLIYLIACYPKNEKENLSPEERNQLRLVIERLRRILKEVYAI